MDENRLRILLSEYFNNSITREDCEELLKYLDEQELKAQEDLNVSQLIDEQFGSAIPPVSFEKDKKANTYLRIMSDIQARQKDTLPNPRKSFLINTKTWFKAAAALFVVFSVGLLIYLNGDNSLNEEQSLVEVSDDLTVLDSQDALITLSDGRTIKVSDSSKGVLSKQDGIQIGRAADGSIYYEVKSEELTRNEQVVYNSFSTPKGSTFQLLLPDGTKVWLNAETTLRFPVAFASVKRVVELDGEAYFEVAHNSSKPFEVLANGSLIKVLGTHFNVSAYRTDRQMATTLVEGSVNVSKNGNALILKPGQQALIDSKTNTISKLEVDVNSILAWKNGYFRFENETIENIISVISRWYDIEEVEYKGSFSDRFTGTFQRSKKLSQLLNHFEKLSPMHFKIEGRRVVIMK